MGLLAGLLLGLVGCNEGGSSVAATSAGETTRVRADARGAEPLRGDKADEAYIKGQLLVAAPGMSDPRFARTVIFMVEHNAEGALGLVVNRIIGSGPIGDMMTKLGIEGGDSRRNLRVYYGGPVELKYAFVLHSTDYESNGGRVVNEKYAMTSRAEILIDIAKGRGPRHSIFALGYAGWGPGQLEAELMRDDWLVVPADDALVFGDHPESAWERAIAKRGVDL